MINSPEMAEQLMVAAREVVEVNPSLPHNPALLPTRYLPVLPGRVQVFHSMFVNRGIQDHFGVAVSYHPEGIERCYKARGVFLEGRYFNPWERGIRNLFGRYRDLFVSEEAAINIYLHPADPKGWNDQYLDPTFNLQLRRDGISTTITATTYAYRSLNMSPEAVSMRKRQKRTIIIPRSKSLPLESASLGDLQAFAFILKKVTG